MPADEGIGGIVFAPHRHPNRALFGILEDARAAGGGRFDKRKKASRPRLFVDRLLPHRKREKSRRLFLSPGRAVA